MVCKKCGNEIQSDEKFCGKCGNKIEINNNNEIKNIVKNKTKRSKSFYYIIGFIVIIFIIIICIAINNNKESISNVSNNKNQEDIVNENKPLNIINQNKKVFNLNIDNLSNELKKVKKDEETANREAFKSSYELDSSGTGKDLNGNLSKSYFFIDTIGKLNQYYKPPFAFATDLDGNIYRIYVLHKFKTEYGSSSVEISPSYYSWLYKALNNLGADDLSITIENLRKETTENYNNYTPDNNGKVYIEKNGVGILQMDAGNNQYGNSAGMYLGYGTK